MSLSCPVIRGPAVLHSSIVPLSPIASALPSGAYAMDWIGYPEPLIAARSLGASAFTDQNLMYRSSPPLVRVAASGLNASAFGRLRWPSMGTRSFFVAGSQIRTVQSWLDDAMWPLSEDQATPLTVAACPLNSAIFTGAFLEMFHWRIIPSVPPDSSDSPLGENATQVTPPGAC